MIRRLQAPLALFLLAILLLNSPIRLDAQSGSQLFPQTGKTVSGRFLEYWRTHGALAQQGYPISNEFNEVSETDGKTYKVQYFERAVFELHPENPSPHDVLLSLLGTFRYQQKYPQGELAYATYALQACTPKYDPNGPDRDCPDFANQAEAQCFYLAAGGPSRDPHRLDRDGDGQACDGDLPPGPPSVPTPMPPSAPPPSTPTARPPAEPACVTFQETGKTVCGRFLTYWRDHGGLAQQGFPISDEFVEVSDLNGQPYTVQYFQRAVFELHPENAPPHDVLLSQLGTFRFRAKYPNGEPGTVTPTLSAPLPVVLPTPTP